MAAPVLAGRAWILAEAQSPAASRRRSLRLGRATAVMVFQNVQVEGEGPGLDVALIELALPTEDRARVGDYRQGRHRARLIAGRSAKLREALGDHIRLGEIGLPALADERPDGYGQGSPQRPGLGRTDVGIVEPGPGGSGKVVIPPGLDGGQPVAQAGQGERVVADGTDVTLGLPEAPSLDTHARVQRIDDAPAEEIPGDRPGGKEQLPRWPGNRGPAGRRIAKQKPESRGPRGETQPPVSSTGRAEAHPAAGIRGTGPDRAPDRRDGPGRVPQ